MISGMHAIIYSKQAERLREFFRDVLKLPSVDAGHGWLIFSAPPTELAVHPGQNDHHELYLMCADIQATTSELQRKGIELSVPIADRGWGLVARLKLPGGDEIGLYEPKHPTAITLKSSPNQKSKGGNSEPKAAARKKNAPKRAAHKMNSR